MAGFNGTGGSDQPLGGCRFSREPVPLRYGKGKVLYLLIFTLGRKARSVCDTSGQLGLFSATVSPDTFLDLFGPVAEIHHIEGVRGMRAFVFLTCVV